MPDLPSGHVDKIDITVVRNKATSVNEIERGKSDWMQSILPADLYNKVKDKYEGTQFRVEHPINIYYFWMNTSKPPFDDLKVRQAVNYAIDTAALERIYSGSLVAAHQILPEEMPGHEAVRPLPARHGQGQGTDRPGQPSRSRHHRLDRQRKPQRRSRRLLPGRARANSASTPS